MNEPRCVEKLNDEEFTWCGNLQHECESQVITLERAFWNKLFESTYEICPTCISEIIKVLSK